MSRRAGCGPKAGYDSATTGVVRGRGGATLKRASRSAQSVKLDKEEREELTLPGAR